MVCVYTHIYSGILLNHKKNKIMPFTATWMDLEIIIRSQRQIYDITYLWNLKNNTNESVDRTGTHIPSPCQPPFPGQQCTVLAHFFATSLAWVLHSLNTCAPNVPGCEKSVARDELKGSEERNPEKKPA